MADPTPDDEPADDDPEPRLLRIAGAIWIAYGAVLLLALLGVVVLIVLAPTKSGDVICPCLVLLLLGLMFIDLGMTARGDGLTDLWMPAVVSFVVGFPHFIVAVLVFYFELTKVSGARNHAITFAIGGINWVASFGLFAAGYLAARAAPTYLPPWKRPRE